MWNCNRPKRIDAAKIGHSRRPAIKLSFRLQTQIFKPGKIVAEIPRLEPELRFGRTLKQGLKVAKFQSFPVPLRSRAVL